MKIPIPEGFEIPPDTAPGGEFNAVATFKDNGDGTITLIALDDSEVEGKDEDLTETGEEPAKVTPTEPQGMYARAKAMGMQMKGP